MRLETQREGYALSLVLLVMIVLTGGVMTAYSLTTTEHWQVDDRQEQLNAFLLAQHGLQTFFMNSQGVRPTNDNCVTYDLSGGAAEVCTYLLRAALSEDDPEFWAVRSRAWRTAAGNPNLPPAARSVAQIAYWEPADLEVKAGLQSLGGVKKNGNSGVISGNDECGESGALPALAIPKDPPYDDKFPGVLKTDLGYDQRISYTGEDAWDAAQEVNIDWKGIVEGKSLKPDLETSSETWTNPNVSKPWPVLLYKGNLKAKPEGQGILIVAGNLEVTGNADWKGIILVGGSLISNGNNTLSGATIAGLNAILGQDVDESQIEETTLNGQKKITYNSCHVKDALEGYSSLVPISNAWMDAWPVVDPVIE